MTERLSYGRVSRHTCYSNDFPGRQEIESQRRHYLQSVGAKGGTSYGSPSARMSYESIGSMKVLVVRVPAACNHKVVCAHERGYFPQFEIEGGERE